jgi:hypothetical protein
MIAVNQIAATATGTIARRIHNTTCGVSPSKRKTGA